ncbi:hypothetical protein FHS16_003951 [Paenibacillus endophyticus]|uniref:Uncharacterized protein n=1 Tax=Paenibacillus endophyticus TaxID=1294268 RepID=A0A7W5C9Z5_9BACL|nr:hypothetical protein [Paenibacillus endophyticus]MBB3153876.1 hypothetical protein [Paenibacillus endophyticus]
MIYGRGINDRGERVTIGQPGDDEESFVNAQSSKAYDFKGYIQIAGSAKRLRYQGAADES